MAKPLSVITFPGGFNWPLFAAEATGCFKRHDLAVTVTPTPNSIFQMTKLAAGEFDLALTAFDNVVAYASGQGAVPLPETPDLVAVMGADTSFLSLIVREEITSFADLRGRILTVDALTTGYAFVLWEMLARAGLEPGAVEIVSVGGMVERWGDLQRNPRHVGTVVSTPYEIQAQAAGFRVLARASELLPAYQGNVAAVRRGWAAEHRAEVAGFVAAWLEGLAWLVDSSNRNAALDLLVANVSGMTRPLAEAAAEILLDPKIGFFRSGHVDRAGVEATIDLRRRFGGKPEQLRPPARLFDESYLPG